MRLLIAVCLTLLAALPAWAAEPSWNGQWDTRWRDGGARMELQQRDNQVTGSYPAYGGQIGGTVQGRELRGQWTEGPRSGQITFVLAPDGQSFMGRFETGEWWTGARVQAAVGGIALDQEGARQALRTFVMAGNAARSGNPNEWAKAAAVVDFGEPGQSMAPGQKLAAARALFELVPLHSGFDRLRPGEPRDHWSDTKCDLLELFLLNPRPEHRSACQPSLPDLARLGANRSKPLCRGTSGPDHLPALCHPRPPRRRRPA